jgi:hypothetical protein
MKNLEEYFAPFRENIVGYRKTFTSPYGEKRIVYADWIASSVYFYSITAGDFHRKMKMILLR